MDNYANVLQTVGLFRGVTAAEMEPMLRCLGSEIRRVEKDEILLLAGDPPRHVGIVLSGQIHVVREDADGNRAMLAAVTAGGIFAEALCCAGVQESPVTVTAGTNAAVMLLAFPRILRTCPNSCAFHAKLIENMLGLIAQKNLYLQRRMEIAGMKSVRAKVLYYLETLGAVRGQEIAIPFNREEMADYLCVERSALSHELARMKSDGLIEYCKNRFMLT